MKSFYKHANSPLAILCRMKGLTAGDVSIVLQRAGIKTSVHRCYKQFCGRIFLRDTEAAALAAVLNVSPSDLLPPVSTRRKS